MSWHASWTGPRRSASWCSGPVARGDDGADSHIDLVVVLPVVTRRHDDGVQVLRVLRDLPVPVDVLSVDKAGLDREAELPRVTPPATASLDRRRTPVRSRAGSTLCDVEVAVQEDNGEAHDRHSVPGAEPVIDGVEDVDDDPDYGDHDHDEATRPESHVPMLGSPRCHRRRRCDHPADGCMPSSLGFDDGGDTVAAGGPA
jgi:predicted nucleotidyltransferase